MKDPAKLISLFLGLTILGAAFSACAQAPGPKPDDGTVRGIFTVTACDSPNMLVTATNKEGKKIVFVLNKETRILKISAVQNKESTNSGNRPEIIPAKISDLTAGTLIRVRYRADSGKNIAVMVVIGQGWHHGQKDNQPGGGEKQKEPSK